LTGMAQVVSVVFSLLPGLSQLGSPNWGNIGLDAFQDETIQGVCSRHVWVCGMIGSC